LQIAGREWSIDLRALLVIAFGCIQFLRLDLAQSMGKQIVWLSESEEMIMVKSIVCMLLIACWAQAEVLRVASFHPLAGDLARQVGGEHVAIVEVMKAGQDPHLFMPSPSDLQAVEGVRLLLVMGKGLEQYLDSLRDALRPGQEIFEIGRMIPSLRMEDDMALFACCPAHALSSIDPHWWHSPRNMKRAARLLADTFAAAVPEHAGVFRSRAGEYGRSMDALDRWARTELNQIPVSRRRLVTAHAAFNYLCSEYRIRATPVLGLSSLEQPRPGQVRHVIDTIRRERIAAIFPEKTANPEVMAAIAKEAGVRLGRPLKGDTPDPSDPTFEAMFRHNVTSIVDALREAP
jgi:zinc/manganese transport system substrate-binding protein